ncbi:MAG: PAS domain-containing protein [Actinobacteria bacterium]|nr:MAG: PAS domain-containing protein [Actinomycetota bacterium]
MAAPVWTENGNSMLLGPAGPAGPARRPVRFAQAVVPTGGIASAARRMRDERGRAHQFRRVFDKTQVPMVTVDNQRRHLEANRAARLLFRLSLAELRQRQIDDLTPHAQLARLKMLWAQLLDEGCVAGPYDVGFEDGSRLAIVFCALANALPGEHLIVFGPAGWPDDELETIDESSVGPLPGPLSPRQREVLALIAEGIPLRDIGERLTIAPATVRTHVENAYRKLGARNRPHAIALALQLGLIEPPPDPT